MEHPELNKQLKLLMLIHEWFEEARRPGQEEPQLEFREDPSGLTIRATRAEALGEELRYEAVDAVNHLRELEASGDIHLHYDNTSCSNGTIALTEEGLQKVRYRRNLQSNLPRRSRGWYLSLLGGEVGLVVQTLWRVNWEGREITIRNRRHLSVRRRRPDSVHSVDEYLNIDNRFPEDYELTKGRFSKDLFGKIRSDGHEHTIHAHIGLTTPWMTTGCRIAVDGMVVGGDISKRFVT